MTDTDLQNTDQRPRLRRALRDERSELDARLRALPRVRASLGFTERLMARIDADERSASPSALGSWRAGGTARLLIAAALLLAAALPVALRWSSNGGEETSAPTGGPSAVTEAPVRQPPLRVAPGSSLPANLQGRPQMQRVGSAGPRELPLYRSGPVDLLAPGPLDDDSEVARLRAEFLLLARELQELRRIAADARPIVEFGSGERVDLELDLRALAPPGPARGGRATRVSQEY